MNKPIKDKRMSIQRNIWILGIVSLLNDITSEAIVPILPIFLTNVLGASPAIIGLIEGVGRATSRISRPVFGWLSDKIRKRRIFVIAGYSLSIIGRGLIAFAISWPIVLTGKFIDRLGKGTRTPARDALIADFSDKKIRGTAFGVHRTLDTAGAIIAPIVVLAIIPFLPKLKSFMHFPLHELNLLFALMLIPAIIAIPLILFVRDSKFRKKMMKEKMTPRFKRLVVVFGLFGLGYFPIAFAILKANELGLNISDVLIVYLIFNIVYTLTAFPAGRASDKFGKKKMLMLSYLLFGFVALGFAFIKTEIEFILVLVLYGIFYAIFEVSSRSFISLLSQKENMGKSYGLFDLVFGITTMFGGIIIGTVWSSFGSPVAFSLSAVISIISTASMLLV